MTNDVNTNTAPERNWPENIVADRHDVSGKWVLHYLTDKQAEQCAAAMQPQVSECDEAMTRDIMSQIISIAANLHVAKHKYFFDYQEGEKPTAKQARELLAKANSELHQIGNDAIKLKEALAAFLSQHRQPAAVSADAVEV